MTRATKIQDLLQKPFGFGLKISDFLHDFGEVAERLVDVEVFVEGDFVADDGFAVVDPSVRDMGQDFLVEIGLDDASVGERVESRNHLLANGIHPGCRRPKMC